MKTIKKNIPLTFLLIVFLFSSSTAEARVFWGWETVSDGTSYVDTGGCIHQVTTKSKYIFWIKVKTVVVDQKVANC